MPIQNLNADADMINLSKSIMEGKCIIFFGAGVSMGAGFPSWSGLVESMLRNAQLDTEMDYGGSLRIADYCKHLQGDYEFHEFMRDEFDKTFVQQEEDPHLLLAKLPCKIYITTNYDTWMEDVLRKERPGEHIEVISSDQDIKPKDPGFADGCTWVIKMHGCIRRNINDIVIGESDYLDYEIKYEKMNDLISRLLQSYTVLFLGYSLSDWNLAKILHQCRKNAKYNKYFLHIGNSMNTNATIKRLTTVYHLIPINRICEKGKESGELRAFFEEIRNFYMIPDWMSAIINSLLGYKATDQYSRRSLIIDIFNHLEMTHIVRFLLGVENAKNVELNIPSILKDIDTLTIEDIIYKINRAGKTLLLTANIPRGVFCECSVAEVTENPRTAARNGVFAVSVHREACYCSQNRAFQL